MEGGHQSTSGPEFQLDGGIPSAGVRRNGCWTPRPVFGGVVGPTTTTTVYDMNMDIIIIIIIIIV